MVVDEEIKTVEQISNEVKTLYDKMYCEIGNSFMFEDKLKKKNFDERFDLKWSIFLGRRYSEELSMLFAMLEKQIERVEKEL